MIAISTIWLKWYGYQAFGFSFILEGMQHNEYKLIENRIRMIRMSREFEQFRVAKALGFTNTNKLSCWEIGKTLPDLVNAFRLAALYHVLVEDLFKGLYDKIREEVLPRESQAERAPRPIPLQPPVPSTSCPQERLPI